ncbi:MAG TPA: Uma2 family endonuclease [Humisphaera sp.]|jgi:Uma2 family endonuclease|nr:Uma2 family endonuclease [Humisphaera sp.]
MVRILDKPEVPQHIVLSGVSWSYYEQTLEEIGNQPIRVAFLDGLMELRSPLPEHDGAKSAIADLIATLAAECQIPRKSFGSTTFRRQEKAAGTEPDACFYFNEIDSVKGMKRFDPLLHRAPDLWIEVDLSNTSVPREPIYARLGVPEVWRYSGDRLSIRLLTTGGSYADSANSRAFPFLPVDTFASFIPRMIEEDESRVLLDFREWVRGLAR